MRTENPTTYAEELLVATNDARLALDLAPLRPNFCAEEAARSRAEELVDEPGLEHAPLTDVTQRCAPGGRAAENLVDSDASPAEVLDAWMGSPGHRNNIVDPGLTEIGIGCVPSDQGMLCSQVFLGDG